jgi:hypothetical protein
LTVGRVRIQTDVIIHGIVRKGSTCLI